MYDEYLFASVCILEDRDDGAYMYAAANCTFEFVCVYVCECCSIIL